MNEQERKDLKFSGYITTPGGIFKRVDINGYVTFDGDVDCLDFRVIGTGVITRNLKSENFEIIGVETINGNAEGGKFTVNGECRVDGNITVNNLEVFGNLEGRSHVTAETIHVSGKLDVRGNCDAESFTCGGTFEVEGIMNVGEVTINLDGASHAKEMVGGKICVKRAQGKSIGKKIVFALANLIDTNRGRLTTDLIEGDDIEIEYTSAKVVRGNNVLIGDGSEIDLVEYRGTFDKTSKANVLKQVKI